MEHIQGVILSALSVLFQYTCISPLFCLKAPLPFLSGSDLFTACPSGIHQLGRSCFLHGPLSI